MPNNFYINETKTNFASKWEMPLEQNKLALNDVHLNSDDFVYNQHRNELIGNKTFVEEWNKYIEKYNHIKNNYYENNKEIVDACTKGEWK